MSIATEETIGLQTSENVITDKIVRIDYRERDIHLNTKVLVGINRIDAGERRSVSKGKQFILDISLMREKQPNHIIVLPLSISGSSHFSII